MSRRKGMCIPGRTHHLTGRDRADGGEMFCVHCGLGERAVVGHATVDEPRYQGGPDWLGPDVPAYKDGKLLGPRGY